ncbi:hypothetical protein LCGC14_2797520, partial [marine sediment metagenome]
MIAGVLPSTDFVPCLASSASVVMSNFLPPPPPPCLAAFGADFLTSAKIADGAFVADNFAASSLNGKGNWNVGKTGYALTVADWASAGDAMDLVANAVDSTSVATAAFTAAKFAADSLDAAALKTDFVDEIV